MLKQSIVMKSAARIVAAYVSNNWISNKDLPLLIGNVKASLGLLASRFPQAGHLPVPAVDPKKSIRNDYLICLEDGKKFKSLKRHLAVRYNMTPAAYRQKWGLPYDYPMVTAEYSARRSEMAKESGLGNSRSLKTAKRSSGNYTQPEN